ncbi:MAG: hypothetical protein R2827_03905 [Bdellovibrionales bacterium]
MRATQLTCFRQINIPSLSYEEGEEFAYALSNINLEIFSEELNSETVEIRVDLKADSAEYLNKEVYLDLPLSDFALTFSSEVLRQENIKNPTFFIKHPAFEGKIKLLIDSAVEGLKSALMKPKKMQLNFSVQDVSALKSYINDSGISDALSDFDLKGQNGRSR